MNRRPCYSWFLLLIGPAPLWAQQPHTSESASPIPVDAFESLSARKAVREGNALLLGGDAEAALDAYVHAENLRPDAPQIPFVQGLAQLARKGFDDARDLFRKAAASDDDQLAADALYSIGASYHKEALEEAEAPEQAIENLEAAMGRYRDVLARYPDHAAARESDYKAASMRRQLKQLLQQQQQQQQQNQDGENQEEQEKNEDQQQSDSDEQQEKSDQQQESDQQQDENQEQQKGDQQQDEQQEQESSEQEQSESEEKEQQAQASEKEEEISREQAERRLREMMQAIRDKQKKRREKVRNVPLPPVDKDW